MSDNPERAPLPHPGAPRREDGFSLIEVLAASVLLAAVMVAIMTMFVYGGQHVKAGKLMTTAVSISSDIHEHFRLAQFPQAYLMIEDAGTPTTDTHYCWDSRGAAAGDCASYNEPADGTTFDDLLDEWREQAESRLPLGSVTITVRGLATLGANPTERNFAQTKLIQIVSTVRWTEQKRDRSVVFESLKL